MHHNEGFEPRARTSCAAFGSHFRDDLGRGSGPRGPRGPHKWALNYLRVLREADFVDDPF